MFRRRANVANTRLATRFIGILLVPGDPVKGDESMRESEWHPRPRILLCHSGDSSELASRLPCTGKSVRNRGVSQTMPYLVIPRSLLRGGFIRKIIRLFLYRPRLYLPTDTK